MTLVFTPTASNLIQPGKYQCVAELAVSADAPSPTWKVMSDPVVLIPIGLCFSFTKLLYLMMLKFK